MGYYYSSSLLSDHESSDLYPSSISPSTFSITICSGAIYSFSSLLIYITTSITYTITSFLILADEFAEFMVELGVYFSHIFNLGYQCLYLLDLSIAQSLQELKF